MNTDKLLEMLLDAIDYSFLQIDGSYDKTLTYPVIDKIQYIKEQLKIWKLKEVDLEKEYKDFVEEDPVYNKLVNGIVGKAIAKRFFEIGIAVSNKAQKRMEECQRRLLKKLEVFMNQIYQEVLKRFKDFKERKEK